MSTYVRGSMATILIIICTQMCLAQADESRTTVDPIQNAMDAAARIRKLRELKIHHALAEDTRMEFIECPLEDVIAFTRDQHDIPIQIDTVALDNYGIGTDVPITGNLKGLSLSSALKHLLNDLELTYTIRDEVLVITTKAAEAEYVTTEIYTVDDLITDNEPIASIADVVRETIGGNDSESPSRIAAFRGNLIVRTSYRGHQQVAELLGSIRAHLRKDNGNAAVGSHPFSRWKAPPVVALNGIRLEAAEIQHIAGQKFIEELELNRCRLYTKVALGLKDLPALHRLSLAENWIDDKALTNIGQFKELRSLTLAKTMIKGDGLSHLSALPKLEYLDLSGTPLTDFSALSQLKHLQSLDISETPFGDEDIAALVGLKHLHTLRINGTKASMDGLTKLNRLNDLRLLTIGGSSNRRLEDPKFGEKLKTLRTKLADCVIEPVNVRLERQSRGDPFRGGADPFGSDGGGDPFGPGQVEGDSDPRTDPFGGGANPFGSDEDNDGPGEALDPFGGDKDPRTNPFGGSGEAENPFD